VVSIRCSTDAASGPALKTIQLLQRIRNADGGENFVADIFQQGKFFADEEPPAS
jgi:hypothetical protein